MDSFIKTKNKLIYYQNIYNNNYRLMQFNGNNQRGNIPNIRQNMSSSIQPSIKQSNLFQSQSLMINQRQSQNMNATNNKIQASQANIPSNNQILLENNSFSLSQQLPQRVLRCPDCNSLLRIQYSCTTFTVGWALFLLIGLTCWVPCVLDACKKSQSRCITCDKIVQVYEPSCC